MLRTLIATFALIAVLTVAASASAEALTLSQSDLLYWTGHETTVTDHFEVEGRWKLTLGATCFEGVGWVEVLVFNSANERVGQVRVLGEGIESVVLEPPPGQYHLQVTVSNFHVYTFEIVIARSDEELTPLEDMNAEGAMQSGTALSAQTADLLHVSHTEVVELPNAWAGAGRNFTTEVFEASGQVEVTFGAWCHDGVSFMDATVFNHDGESVGSVRVVGEGVQSAVFDLAPGAYYVTVSGPDVEVYTWELVIDAQSEAASADEAASEPTGERVPSAAAGASSEPLSGVVEVGMYIDGSETFFLPAGVWVEPGTTIRFVLVGEGVHDSRAYHPSNGVSTLRIPEGAEPWDSGLIGGLLNPGPAYEVTLTVEGVYDYFCLPHLAHGMVGRIIVGDPNAAPARPLEEIQFEAARAALPSVEEILAAVVVDRAGQH